MNLIPSGIDSCKVPDRVWFSRSFAVSDIRYLICPCLGWDIYFGIWGEGHGFLIGMDDQNIPDYRILPGQPATAEDFRERLLGFSSRSSGLNEPVVAGSVVAG